MAQNSGVTTQNPTQTRRFYLMRTEDETGMSGTGCVAEGIEFSNGYVAMVWRSPHASIAIYPNIKELEWIHSHGGSGKTHVVWIDEIGGLT